MGEEAEEGEDRGRIGIKFWEACHYALENLNQHGAEHGCIPLAQCLVQKRSEDFHSCWSSQPTLELPVQAGRRNSTVFTSGVFLCRRGRGIAQKRSL
jgi:hypothetical protein